MIKKGQSKILDALMLEELDVAGLMEVTDLSSSYVRNSLKIMELSGYVEKVDQRIPHIYRIPTESPFIKHKNLVALYEEKIATVDKSNSIVKMLSAAPKDEWISLADDLEAAAIALRNLNSERRLIETLDP